MMKRSLLSWKPAALLVLSILAGPPLDAGVVFQVETTYHSGSGSGRTERSEMWVRKPDLKIEIRPGESGTGEAKDEVVFRGDRRQMVVIDHDDKTYMIIDGKAIRQLGGQMQGQMQEAMKQLEEKLSQIKDPQQRAMMERMLKGQLGSLGAGNPPRRAPSEIRNTGERGTRQGYPCVRYDVLRDGQKIRELWVTDWSNIRGGKEAVDVFQEMGSFVGELMDSFGDMMGPGAGNFFAGDGNPLESFNQVDGFPVVTRSFKGGELESETVLESVTERDLDPDAFEPPKGYSLRTLGPQ